MRSDALQNALRRAVEREAMPATDDEALLSEPDWNPLLDLVAAAWLVDAHVYDRVILRRLGELHALEELTVQPDMEPVPRMPGAWRVKDSVREARAAAWTKRTGGEESQRFFT